VADTDDNPYVGPRPFERRDRALFFGRDAEARELLSLIVSERIVLLYAASGAGKTSLLHAGVAPLLEEEEHFEVLPVARIRTALREDALALVRNVYTAGVLAALAEHDGAGEPEPDGALDWTTLAEFLSRRPHAVDEQGLAAPRALIVDQFEELFTVYPRYWRQREEFVTDIAAALAADPLLRVVLAIREDYLAQLDPFATLLPRELRTRFRLERLGPDDAIAAVVKPTVTRSRSYAPGVAEKLVADLLRFRIDTGRGRSVEIEGEYVEPVQLQVTCQSLWDELPDGVDEITEDHLRTFGDVDEVLRRFYDEAVHAAAGRARMSEARIRARVGDSFITAVGTRNTVYRQTDETGGLPNTAIDELENRRVIRAEWRAGTRWYELTHDRLIAPIQSSNARFRARLARRRRRLAIGVALVAAVLALAGWAWLAAGDDLRPGAAAPTIPDTVNLSVGAPRFDEPRAGLMTTDVTVSTTGMEGVDVQLFASVVAAGPGRGAIVERPEKGPSVRPRSDAPNAAIAPVAVTRPTRAGTYRVAIEARWLGARSKRAESAQFVIHPNGTATLPSLEIGHSGPGVIGAQLEGTSTRQYCPPSCSLSFSKGQKVTLIATPDRQSRFVGWIGCPSTTRVCILEASRRGDTTVGATFARTHVLGPPSSGSPISALEIGNPKAERKVLVVGCTAPPLCQGTKIAEALARKKVPADVDLWIIPQLNPDRTTNPTPNRNFPCKWVSKPPYNTENYSAWTKDCAGSAALSQRETRAAYDLIERLRPALTIWYSQWTPTGADSELGKQYPSYVDEFGGARTRARVRRYARLVDLPTAGAPQNLEPLGGYPGSGTSWQANEFPDDVAFWVELPARSLSKAEVEKHADAILAIARKP